MPIQTLGLQQPEHRSTILNNPAIPLSSPAVWSLLSAEGNGTEAGESISWESSLQISTVYACVRILAESISSLPVRLYKLSPQGRMIDAAHPLANLLAFEANPEMASGDWIETIVSHLAITGNSYSQIQRGLDGEAVALWPLNPRKTDPARLPGGPLAYRTFDGMTNGQSRIIQAADMLHLRLNSWDGVLGMSPVMMAKRSLGLAVAAEKFGSRLFANGGTPQLALTCVNPIKPDVKVQMKQDWRSMQTGGNQHNIAVLDSDLKIEKLSISPEEAQFLEARRYSRSDIAALFRIPAHMIGELQKLSNSNTEEMNSQFVTDASPHALQD